MKGQRKGCLYENLSSEERLVALAQLNEQVSGKAAAAELRELARSEWSGEVFEVARSADD